MAKSFPLIMALLVLIALGSAFGAQAQETGKPVGARAGDGSVTKAVLRGDQAGKNLLNPAAWQALERGFERQGDQFVCDNGSRPARRGLAQHVVLNQREPQPIVASAWSKAEGVSGAADADFSVYLDLVYSDGSPLWGQQASFRVGTHDWQRAEVLVMPEKAVRSVTFNLLFRGHAGKAWFRNPVLQEIKTPTQGVVFDGVPVVPRGSLAEGFQVRDVAAAGDFMRIEHEALGLQLDVKQSGQLGTTFFDVSVRDLTGKDRAVTLLYTIPVPPAAITWLDDPRQSRQVEKGREYVHATLFKAGQGRLSTYPLAALGLGEETLGLALGLDMAYPAFFRIGYNAGTGEFWIAYDLGFAPEKPEARLRFCQFDFAPEWGFRSALAAYYRLFPEAFQRRVTQQGLWMPFAKISQIKGYQDFGFRFKEGNDETAWDDAHGIVTFHYTEPLTWWMPMPRTMPWTLVAAAGEAKRLAQRGMREARALFTSGYHNADGEFAALIRDEPWNHGAVWSMNSMPGIAGDSTDFKAKWNAEIKARLYGPARRGDLDGEYIDSSEGYVTDELDFRRDHFAAAQTPLVYSRDTHRPAIFRGLIAFEYVRAIAADMHGMNKLMMANSTPDRLCWLAPMLDVLGTETDWNPLGKWRPMSDAALLYRRALCKGKPYCFLMNTDFEHFSSELVEKYMKRSLAFGFFPGFFSHNASEGHYFTRPELYDRDRPLFRKYVPLCKAVAQAGWEPITLARSSDERVCLERFGGQDPWYLTAFNDSTELRTTTITLDSKRFQSCRELLSGRAVTWSNGRTTISLDGEELAVLELRH
jgi:hypothetical protein